jgi:hypothetical protein
MNVTEIFSFSNAFLSAAKENPILMITICLLVIANMLTKRKSR